MTDVSATQAKRGILIVVEGEVAEPRLMKCLLERLGIRDENEIFSYGTDIHDLMDHIENDYANDFEDIDLLTVLSDLRPEKRSWLQEHRSALTDIVLVFDYDPQDDRFDACRLVRFAGAFCDSADRGMLYVNYPSLEAVRHLKSFEDEGYLTRVVDRADCRRYKQIVDSEGRDFDIEKLDRMKFAQLVAINASKVQCLLGVTQEKTIMHLRPEKIAVEARSLDLLKALCRENRELDERKRVLVCNTSVLFACGWPKELDSAWRCCRM